MVLSARQRFSVHLAGLDGISEDGKRGMLQCMMGVTTGVHAVLRHSCGCPIPGGRSQASGRGWMSRGRRRGKPSAQELSSPGQQGAGLGASMCPRRTTGCLGTLGHSHHRPHSASPGRQTDGRTVRGARPRCQLWASGISGALCEQMWGHVQSQWKEHRHAPMCPGGGVGRR